MLSRVAQTSILDDIIIDGITLDSEPAARTWKQPHLEHFTRLAEHYYYSVLQLSLLYLIEVLPN